MSVAIQIVPDDTLVHHGILGQKWGVRRYQNPDGTLTEAGRKRYDVNVEEAKSKVTDAKEKQKQATKAYNLNPNSKTNQNKLAKAAGATDWAKTQLSNEKAKEELNNSTSDSKSKRRIALEQEYKNKGMSDEEAEIAAYKRAKVEKALAITAGMTVAAAAAYVAYKHYDNSVDKIIKSGTLLQNISTNDNRSISDAFYFSMTNSDNTKYRGIYGDQLSNYGRNKVFETKIKTTDNLKVASNKSATKALSELCSKDKSYAKALQGHLQEFQDSFLTGKQERLIKDSLNALSNGTVNQKVYEALNLSLAAHTTKNYNEVSTGFYNTLKSKGYDAIMDINDKKYSGYNSQKPTIAFNAGAKAAIDSVREVSKEETSKDFKKGYANILAKEITPSIAGVAAIAGVSKIVAKNQQSSYNDKIVKEYKKEHPDSKLSYNEILNNYYGL